MEIEPSTFCVDSDIRSICREPFIFEGKLIATNGWSLLISPERRGFIGVEDTGASGQTKELIKSLSAESLKRDYEYLEVSMPEKHVCATCGGTGEPVTIKCPECSGDGYVYFENNHSFYDCDCLTCQSKGTISTANERGKCDECNGVGEVFDKDDLITISDLKFKPKAIELITSSNGVLVSPDLENKRLFFKCGEQYGVIMATYS